MADSAHSSDDNGDGSADDAPPLLGPELENALTALARWVTAGVGHGTHAALDLTPRGQWLATLGSDALAHTVTGLQYGCRQGPALEGGAARYVADLSADGRWPLFAAGGAELGIRALMTAPLTEPDGRVMGQLALYARQSDPYDAVTRDRVRALADWLSSTITMLLTSAFPPGDPVPDCYGALADRVLVEQAVGVLMTWRGCDARTARTILRRDALRRGATVRATAATILAGVGRPPDTGDFGAPGDPA